MNNISLRNFYRVAAWFWLRWDWQWLKKLNWTLIHVQCHWESLRKIIISSQSKQVYRYRTLEGWVLSWMAGSRRVPRLRMKVNSRGNRNSTTRLILNVWSQEAGPGLCSYWDSLLSCWVLQMKTERPTVRSSAPGSCLWSFQKFPVLQPRCTPGTMLLSSCKEFSRTPSLSL